MYMQVGCLMENEQLGNRIKHALVLGSAGVFIALFVINWNDFMRKVSENSFVDWDVKTMTAGDYTIEFDLHPDFYKHYLEEEMDKWIEESKKEDRVYLSKLQSF